MKLTLCILSSPCTQKGCSVTAKEITPFKRPQLFQEVHRLILKIDIKKIRLKKMYAIICLKYKNDTL